MMYPPVSGDGEKRLFSVFEFVKTEKQGYETEKS